MSRIDEVLRQVTADIDTSPQAQERIHDEVMRGIARDEAAPLHRYPHDVRRRSRRLLPVAAGAVATAGIAAAALFLTSGGGGGPSLVDRAEAAVTPAGRIVHIVATYRAGDAGQAGSAGSASAVSMEDWTVAGPGRSLRMRRLITSTPPGTPPDDEDTVITLDADGAIASAASWTPPGRLTIGLPAETVPFATSWAALLAEAYRTGGLKEAGTTADGLLRLRGRVFPAGTQNGCESSEVTLDPATFEPRSLRSRSGCDAADIQLVTITFTVDRLPETSGNEALLRIGSWPVTEAVRTALDGTEVPVPVEQAKREAGLG